MSTEELAYSRAAWRIRNIGLVRLPLPVRALPRLLGSKVAHLTRPYQGCKSQSAAAAEPSFEDQSSFSNAYNAWFNGQTQWVSTGQQAISAALQRAALPPRLILKLVSWSGVSAQQNDAASTIFPWAGAGAVAGGTFGGYEGASYTFSYFQAVEAAELIEYGGPALFAMGAGDSIAGGMIAGASLGLVPGAIIGGVIGVGVYLYESQ